MPDYINPTTVSIAVTFITAIYALIRTMAPKTQTKLDDNFVSLVEKGRVTVNQFALPIWAVVEEMQKSGKISQKSKFGEYLGMFRDLFRRTHGADMPKELEAEAETLAAGISASDKLQKKTLLSKEPAQ